MAEVREFWEREGRPASGEEPPSAHDVLIMHAALRAHERAVGRGRGVGQRQRRSYA